MYNRKIKLKKKTKKKKKKKRKPNKNKKTNTKKKKILPQNQECLGAESPCRIGDARSSKFAEVMVDLCLYTFIGENVGKSFSHVLKT